MNQYEYIMQTDSNYLNTAYRILTIIKDDVSMGLVGISLRNKYHSRYILMGELRKDATSWDIQDRIHRYMVEVERYFKMEEHEDNTI